MVERFFDKFDAKRRYLQKSYTAKSGKRLTIRTIAATTGMPYETVVCHLVRRNRTIGVQEFDKYLFATGISILELIEPSEFASYLRSLDSEDLGVFNKVLWPSFKEKIDTRRELESNRASDQSAASQMSAAVDETEITATSRVTNPPKRSRA